MPAITYRTILYTVSRVKRVAKDIKFFNLRRGDATGQSAINKENIVNKGRLRRPGWFGKSWVANQEPTSLDRKPLPVSSSSSTYPIPSPIAEKKGEELHREASIPGIPAKHYRVKRKPVPPLPADLLANFPDDVVHTSIVEKSVIQTFIPLNDPPSSTASTPPFPESSPASDESGAVPRSGGSGVITQVENKETTPSSVTRSCLNVVADEASSRFAFYWPSQHSYQPLSHTMSRLADGSLNASRITHERLIKIAIRKPTKYASTPYRVPNQRKKLYRKAVDYSQDSSELKSLMTQKNDHI